MRIPFIALFSALALSTLGCHDKPGGGSGEARADTASTSAAGDAPQGGTTSAPTSRSRAFSRVAKADAAMNPLHADSPEIKEVAAAEYPEAGISAIAASCKKPWVVLARSKSDDAFPAIVQALYANPAFKVADADPHSAGELTVEVHKKDEVVAVARCHDAGTCTRLAAMMKAVARDSSPETGCGELPGGLGASTRVHALSPALPKDGDSAALCARLGACKLAKDPASTEDPVGACQRSPSSFPVSCALKASCDEVLSCH